MPRMKSSTCTPALTVKGADKVEIGTDGSLKLSGASISIESQGTINITGGSVRISGNTTIDGRLFMLHTHQCTAPGAPSGPVL